MSLKRVALALSLALPSHACKRPETSRQNERAAGQAADETKWDTGPTSPAPAAAASTVEDDRRLQSYLDQCAAALGYVPSAEEADCATGAVMPFPATLDGKTTEAAGSPCDLPLKFAGACSTGSTLGVVRRAAFPTTVWVRMCRTAPELHGGFKFRDLIGYNAEDGSTCFLNFANQGVAGDIRKVPTSTVIYPKDPLAGGAPCATCHDADPFIVSPAIDHAVKALKLDWPDAAKGKLKVVGLDYDAMRTANTLDLVPHVLNDQDAGACGTCHRIGRELCTRPELLEIIGLQGDGTTPPHYAAYVDPDRTSTFNAFPRSTSMPPDSAEAKSGASYDEWLKGSSAYGKALAHILDCCSGTASCAYVPTPWR